jgi:ABC-type multidrug transport system, permease component
MQVFNTYFKILKKRLMAIIIYASIFLFLTIAMTANAKVDNKKFETSKVKIMVMNEDGKTPLLKGFMKYLGDYAIIVEPKQDEEARKDALFYQKVEYILTIPAGFSEQFLKDGTVTLTKQTVPNSVNAMSVDNAINNYFNIAKVYQKNIKSLNVDQLNAYIAKNIKSETSVKLDVKVQDDVTYSNGFNKFFFNTLGYIILAAFITSVSMIMFSFNGVDIRRRHTAAPLTSRKLNIILLLANLVFVLAYLLVFVVAGYMLNRSRIININLLFTWLNALVFGITVLSISYLIGITVNSRKTIGALSTAVSLSLAFLSGIFVPQQYLGGAVLKVASFTPSYWYVKANDALELISGFHWKEMSTIFGYMAIQIGFAVAFICIAMVVSKRKRQQAF